MSQRGNVTPGPGAGRSVEMRQDWGTCQSREAFPGLFLGLWGLLTAKEHLGVPQCPPTSPSTALWAPKHQRRKSCCCDVASPCPSLDPPSAHSYTSFRAPAEPPPPGSLPECPRPGVPMVASLYSLSCHRFRLSSGRPVCLALNSLLAQEVCSL